MRSAVPALILIASSQAQAGITLESPRDYQVFQRAAKSGGKIAIRGRSTESCPTAQANGVARQVEADCELHGELAMPAGGWYKVEVRAGGAAATVEHVKVGRSSSSPGNLTRRTTGGAAHAQRMVSTFDGTAWRPADDPQPGVQDSSRQGSFIPSFGDALYARLKVPIGVACVGSGGTSVRQWLPKGERFHSPPTSAKFFSRVSESEWESDGRLFQGMSGPEYRRMMERLISATRSATWEFPWMVAQASYHTPADRSDPDIRAAQASLWKDKIA